MELTKSWLYDVCADARVNLPIAYRAAFVHNINARGINYPQLRIMKHFSIIQTLCRIGLGTENLAFRHQVERLREALALDGDEKGGKALQQLLTGTKNEESLTPSRFVPSAAALSASPAGETLSPRTAPPSDRETGAPLAEILFPEKRSASPVLPKNLKHSIDQLLMEWQNCERLAEVGVSPPRSCMVFGAPGTGKTHLAHYVAAQLGLPLVVARLDGLVSSFLGTTARNLGALFDFCNRYKCVLLLDEFDAIAKVRDDPQEVGEIKRVVNTLLQNIDSRASRGFTIAITNHESLLDNAVWRRFEVRIALPLPDDNARELILERYLPPVKIPSDQIRFLAWLTDGMTGSDIRIMTNAMKRQIGLANGARPTVLELADQFAITHAGSKQHKRLSLLSAGPQELVRAAMADKELQMTQGTLASIIGRDQTTISRWTNKIPAGKR
jgi:MoxR-like ATPase